MQAHKMKTTFGQSTDEGEEGHYEWEWLQEPTRPKTTKNGTSGWAKLLKSSNAKNYIGRIICIHLCAHNPCAARHEPSKYGLVGPPVHMQPVAKPGDASAIALPPPEAPPPGSSASAVQRGTFRFKQIEPQGLLQGRF